ncbi:MAG: hypothetical protein J07HX5_01487 [halophilic archaeon J07HX5]|nr:MAG: hypothetical protein J07HX5_01487 [halophilic archaeon J07HX5]
MSVTLMPAPWGLDVVCPFADSKTELKITLDSMTPRKVGCVDETVNYNGPLTVPDW